MSYQDPDFFTAYRAKLEAMTHKEFLVHLHRPQPSDEAMTKDELWESFLITEMDREEIDRRSMILRAGLTAHTSLN